jgi:hypothetical protein
VGRLQLSYLSFHTYRGSLESWDSESGCQSCSGESRCSIMSKNFTLLILCFIFYLIKFCILYRCQTNTIVSINISSNLRLLQSTKLIPVIHRIAKCLPIIRLPSWRQISVTFSRSIMCVATCWEPMDVTISAHKFSIGVS